MSFFVGQYNVDVCVCDLHAFVVGVMGAFIRKVALVQMKLVPLWKYLLWHFFNVAVRPFCQADWKSATCKQQSTHAMSRDQMCHIHVWLGQMCHIHVWLGMSFVMSECGMPCHAMSKCLVHVPGYPCTGYQVHGYPGTPVPGTRYRGTS